MERFKRWNLLKDNGEKWTQTALCLLVKDKGSGEQVTSSSRSHLLGFILSSSSSSFNRPSDTAGGRGERKEEEKTF